MGYIGIIGYILGYYRDNGKGNGNYYRESRGEGEVFRVLLSLPIPEQV